MAAVDFLPIAQPAARPDATADRKPASKETDKDSFAGVLETEVEAIAEPDDTASKTEPRTETDGNTKPHPADAAAQPAPPIAQANTAATVIAAVLQAPALVLQTQGEMPVAEGEQAQAAGAAAPAIDTNVEPSVSAETAIQPVAAPKLQPAVAPIMAETAAIPAASAATAGGQPASPQMDAAAQVNASSRAKISADTRVAADDVDTQPEADGPLEMASAAETSTQPMKTAQQATATSTTVATAQTNDAAVIQAVSVVATQTPITKPIAPPTHSENAPGHRRNAQGETTVPAHEMAAATKSGAQQTRPVASAQTSNGQAKQAAAQPTGAEAAIAEAKADAAPAPATSSGHASFADTLTAARGHAPEAARTPANPHLQSAPAATLQVYTRMIERFDGRAQRFEVRLDPAELGRVDVRIEVGADKKVHAVLAAHDSAALTDLMRGQRALERALSDAGIDIADNGIRFEMSQDSGRNFAGQQRGDGRSNEEMAHTWRGFSTAEVEVEANAADIAVATRTYARRSSRLDVVA